MRKVWTFILGINIGLFVARVDAVTTLENGAICLRGVQCQSGNCIVDDELSVGFCMPTGAYGQRCYPKSLTGILRYPSCTRGLDCTGSGESAFEFGLCSDQGDLTYIGTSGGYVKSSYTASGITKYVYRCADGYYGISHDIDEVNTPTGCKPCPSNARCPEAYNDEFFCNNGYYAAGNQCVQCPAVGRNASNDLVYGTTEIGLFSGGAERCYVPKGTYTDATGTFELGETCYYTP